MPYKFGEIMPYTFEDAEREIGTSTSWRDAFTSSLAKWEQIASGDYDSYPVSCDCGFCIVAINRNLYVSRCETECPAYLACAARHGSAEDVLRLLRDIDWEKWDAE